MKAPKPIYNAPGQDPTEGEYQVPGMSCTGCVTIIGCILLFGWLVYVGIQASKPMSTVGLPTVAFSSTPDTPTATYTATITFTPSSTVTGTQPPTATDSLETRVYGKLITGTAITLTATYTPSITATPTFTATPRPPRTRRPAQPGNPSNPPAAPTVAPIGGGQPVQPPPPQYTPLPAGWQPSPIWNGQPLPTIDYSTTTPSPTLEVIEPTIEITVEPTLTMIPTETPTETPTPTLTLAVSE